MKILLINVRYNEADYRYRVNKLCPPLGPAYIAAVLRSDGNQVAILDMEAERMEYDALPSYLKRECPDIIGIHGTTPTSHFIAQCAAKAKETCPNATIVVGGAHASLMPEATLKEMPSVDYILRGEAEYTMRELVRCLDTERHADIRQIPGIGFRDGAQIIVSSKLPQTEDIDSLPLPAYDLLPLDAYFYGAHSNERGAGQRVFTVMSSRGCPHKCTFCCAPALYGSRYRARSARSVVDEIEFLVDHYGVTHIVFYDASFSVNTGRVERICREILDRSLSITWQARVRADSIDESLLGLMKESGCVEIAIGVETGSQRLLDSLNKKCTLKEIETAFRIAKKMGVGTLGYFMFGIPGETREDSEQTIEFAKRLDPDWALFTHVTPLPGTKLFEMVEDQLLTRDWSQFRFCSNSPVLSYDGMTQAEMKDIMARAFRSFYIRKEWLQDRMERATSREQRDRIIGSFFDYLEKLYPEI